MGDASLTRNYTVKVRETSRLIEGEDQKMVKSSHTRTNKHTLAGYQIKPKA